MSKYTKLPDIHNVKTVKYLEQLVEEVEILLKQKCYISALNNTMILLDSMTKSNNYPYKNLKESERFKNFCDNVLNTKNEIGLSGEEIYSIRNFMFHEGYININTKHTIIKELNFYINTGIVHQNTIYDIGMANIDIMTFISTILEFFKNNKNNFSDLEMSKITIIK